MWNIDDFSRQLHSFNKKCFILNLGKVGLTPTSLIRRFIVVTCMSTLNSMMLQS